MNKVMICSVSPEKFSVARMTYNCFVDIDAAKPGGYSFTWITDHEDTKRFYEDLTHVSYVPFPIAAQEIVGDIFKTEQMEEKGCFIPKGEHPTEEELDTARARRTDYLLKCANIGERLYGQFGTRGLEKIPDFAKRAVLELGEDREWVFSNKKPKFECPGCGEKIPTLSTGELPAICRGCGAILNAKKAAELFPANASTAKPKRKYTRKVQATEATA